MDGSELTIGQEALWFLQQLTPDSSAYNTSGAVNLHFAVDVEVLSLAVHRVVSGHRMLNCVFRSFGGEVRRFRGGVQPTLEVHEAAMDDQAVRKLAIELVQRPFQLDRELPIRFSLLRRATAPDILLMAAHHIVVDHTSILLIFQESLAEYAALSAGTERAVKDTSADFDEFVRRHRKYLASPEAEAASTYWRAELSRIPAGDLPTDLPRPDRYRFTGSEIDVELSPSDMTAVGVAASARNTRVFAYLFSVFQLLLYTHGGQTDFVTGYPATLRRRRFRESIGYFVNTLPFRVRVDPSDSFDALLQRTDSKLWQGWLHREYPHAMMPRLLDAPRELNRAGLISTTFGLTEGNPHDPFTEVMEPGRRTEHAGLSISKFHVPHEYGQFDLTLQVHRYSTGARAVLRYNTSLFTEETARNLAFQYSALLRAAASDTLPAELGEAAAVTDH